MWTKILQIVHLLDSNYLDPDLVDLVKITYNKASDVLEDLRKVFGGGAKDSPTGVNFTSLDRMNSILVMANSKRALEEAKTWIERLDAPTGRSVQTFVYTVENSTASNIAMILIRAVWRGRRRRHRHGGGADGSRIRWFRLCRRHGLAGGSGSQ